VIVTEAACQPLLTMGRRWRALLGTYGTTDDVRRGDSLNPLWFACPRRRSTVNVRPRCRPVAVPHCCLSLWPCKRSGENKKMLGLLVPSAS